MDSTFKTAEPPSAEPVSAQTPEFQPAKDVVVTTGPVPKDTNLPMEQYYKENDNNPYATQFFDLDTPFNFLPSTVQQKMKDIDKFVDREIADRGWKHTTHNYEQVLSDTMLELGDLGPEVMDQIEKIHGYATNILKLDGLDDVRRTIKNRLRRMASKKDMDNFVLKEIGKKII